MLTVGLPERTQFAKHEIGKRVSGRVSAKRKGSWLSQDVHHIQRIALIANSKREAVIAVYPAEIVDIRIACARELRGWIGTGGEIA